MDVGAKGSRPERSERGCCVHEVQGGADRRAEASQQPLLCVGSPQRGWHTWLFQWGIRGRDAGTQPRGRAVARRSEASTERRRSWALGTVRQGGEGASAASNCIFGRPRIMRWAAGSFFGSIAMPSTVRAGLPSVRRLARCTCLQRRLRMVPL